MVAAMPRSAREGATVAISFFQEFDDWFPDDIPSR
jgi:hypothetical protein